MTDADAEMIAELERLNAERTQGEWSAEIWAAYKVPRTVVVAGPAAIDDDQVICESRGHAGEKDAPFIATAANAMPRLLALAKEAQAARAEAERLREALERIAGFAPGYGEIAEQIAQMARHALDPELAAMHEAWRAALTQEQRDD